MLSCWGLIQVRESVKKSPWPLQSYQHSWLTWHPWKIDLLPQSIKISPLPWKARKTWFVWPGSGFPDGLDGKESACNAGDSGLISRSRRSHGEGNDNLLQYSCLGNPTDRGAWWATVHGLPRLRHDGATEHTHIRVSRKFRDISFCLFVYLLDAWGTLIERLRMKKVMFFI